MSDVFPKWTNRLLLYLVVGLGLLSTGLVAGFWYYFTPKYTRVGYQPLQPVAFSHATHAGQLRVDCRYCHQGADKSWHAGFPSAALCINCHNQVMKDDPRLTLVRESFQTGQPISWVQVHKQPDYVYYHHAAHVNRGISCVHCHGEVQKMEETRQVMPLSMTFCLDCHRNPNPTLRPLEKVTDLTWNGQTNLPPDWSARAAEKWRINGSVNCSTCHR